VPIMAVNSAVLATQCSLAQGNWTTSKHDFIGKGAQIRVPCLAKPPESETLPSIDQTASVVQSPGEQIRTGLQIVVDHIRKKTPLHDEGIKPFPVDKTNLD
jgi:hypothetical protein